MYRVSLSIVMTKKRHCLSLLFAAGLAFLAWPARAQAEEIVGVPASYNINYNVSDSGEAKVQMFGELYNPKQDVFISQYTIALSLPDARDVEAYDGRGKLNPIVEKKDKQTRITIKFNDRVVGTDKPLSFRLNYTSGSIAQKSGLVWEVNIPKASDFKYIKDYNVTLTVPENFGPQIFGSPNPVSVEKTLTRMIYKYDKSRLFKTGAILSFGPYQAYSLDLKYHLKNSGFFSGTVKVALPPSILSEQQIIFDQIYPLPTSVETDADGNYIASFDLPAGKTTVVTVKGKAKVLNTTRNVSQSGTFSEIPQGLKTYTSAQKYWEVGNPKIAEIVKSVAGEITPQSNVGSVAQKLFDYTTKTLTYDDARIKPDLTRFGAIKALENSQHAVCMEFADLLVTLLRQAGIPAELLEGYADTKDTGSRPAIGDVLHSWVRLYLPRLGWLSVDPTWSNTTGGLDYFGQLDTNHLIFAIKGANSETPYPAGAYKISPDQVGDINVGVLDLKTEFNSEDVVFSSENFESPPLGKDKSLTLNIANEGKQTLFAAKLALNAGIFGKNAKTIQLGDLPPYGRVVKYFTLKEEPADGANLGNLTFINFDGRVGSKSVSYALSKKNNNAGVFWPPAILVVATVALLYGTLKLWLRRKPTR